MTYVESPFISIFTILYACVQLTFQKAHLSIKIFVLASTLVKLIFAESKYGTSQLRS